MRPWAARNQALGVLDQGPVRCRNGAGNYVARSAPERAPRRSEPMMR